MVICKVLGYETVEDSGCMLFYSDNQNSHLNEHELKRYMPCFQPFDSITHRNYFVLGVEQQVEVGIQVIFHEVEKKFLIK